jgi:hypothetical protein
MAYTLRAADVFAPTDNSGETRAPSLGEASRWGTEVEVTAAAAALGITEWRNDLADLPASTDGTVAVVLDDGTASNNGIYVRVSGSWVKRGPLPAMPGPAGPQGDPGNDGADGADADMGAVNSAISTAVAAEAAARATAVTNEATARALGDKAAPLDRVRPGVNPNAFASDAAGGPSASPLGGTTVNTNRGPMRQWTEAFVLVAGDNYPVASGEAWWARVTFLRAVNPTDPSGHSVRVEIIWFDADNEILDSEVVFPSPDPDLPLWAADGYKIVTFRFGSLGHIAPPGAVVGRVALVGFGDDGTTRAGVVQVGPIDPFAAALETITIATLTADPLVAEHGASVTPELEWTITGPGTVAEQRINGVDIGSTTDRDWTAGSAITADTMYTLAVDDEQGRTVTRTVTVDFQHRVFWGGAATAPANSAAVLALDASELATGRAREKAVTLTDEYPVIAYPTALGAHTQITGNGFEMSGEVVSTVSVTTSAGFTGNYYVVRWPQKVTGTVTIGII